MADRTLRLTPKGLEERGKFLATAAANHGPECIERWAKDPEMVSIINAVAQLAAREPAIVVQES